MRSVLLRTGSHPWLRSTPVRITVHCCIIVLCAVSIFVALEYSRLLASVGAPHTDTAGSDMPMKSLTDKRFMKDMTPPVPVVPAARNPSASADLLIPAQALGASAPSSMSIRVRQHNQIIDLEPTDYHTTPDGALQLTLPFTRRFSPGRWSAEIRAPETNRAPGRLLYRQDFLWGAVAMNTDQDHYATGDTARLHMSVLDDGGHTVCDAYLSLSVTAPDGTRTILSTQDDSITVHPDCSNKAATAAPDYATTILLEQEGTYAFFLMAETVHGTRFLESSVTVTSAPALRIRRESALRIRPTMPSTMRITIAPDRTFTGTITEYIASSLEVSASDPPARTSVQDDVQLLTWEGTWHAGETYTFTYRYDAPPLSPYAYVMGPLTLSDAPSPFASELRVWQVVADTAATEPSSSSADPTDTFEPTIVPLPSQHHAAMLTDTPSVHAPYNALRTLRILHHAQRVVDIPVDFNQGNRSFRNHTILRDDDLSSAVFHDPSPAAGDRTTFTLYVPKHIDHTRVRVCFGKTTIGCTPEDDWSFLADESGSILETTEGVSTSGITVSVADQHWVIDGLTGTSGQGELPPLASNTYAIPSDVIVSGGGDTAQSTNYSLQDSIGEPIIGFSSTDSYQLDAGYRQTDEPVSSLSLSCGGTALLDNILFSGTVETDVSCTVITDNTGGYQLSWQVLSGSGGMATGSLISQFNETIAPYVPAVAGTPETWTVDPTDAAWGGRLLSASTDTDAMWGTDAVSEKWLNVGTGSFVIVQRLSATAPTGSVQQIGFRVEVGASAVTPSGIYQTTITMTVSSL